MKWPCPTGDPIIDEALHVIKVVPDVLWCQKVSIVSFLGKLGSDADESEDVIAFVRELLQRVLWETGGHEVS